MGRHDGSPFSSSGRAHMEIDQLRNELHRKADQHEIHSLNSDVASLERSLGETLALCDELRSRITALEETVRVLQEEAISKAEGKEEEK